MRSRQSLAHTRAGSRKRAAHPPISRAQPTGEHRFHRNVDADPDNRVDQTHHTVPVNAARMEDSDRKGGIDSAIKHRRRRTSRIRR